MRRLSLSTKLFAAALPLIIAVGGLLALTVISDLDEIDRAESGAQLGGVWEPLIVALNAVEAEASTLINADINADGADAAEDADLVDPAARRATDQAINDVRDSINELGAAEAAGAHVTASRSALSAARRNIDMAEIAPTMAGDIDPVEAYGIASRELVAVGQLLPSEAGDETLGRQLLAVVKLAEANLHANDVIAATSAWPNEQGDTTPLVQARDSFGNLVTTLGEFEAIASEDWGATFRESSFNTTLGSFNTSLSNVARAADAGRIETFDTAAFSEFIDQVVDFERTISESIVAEANAQADATRTATMRRIGIILAIVLVAAVVAWVITRSITRRVKAVADSANLVASEQLPALVEALRDPRGKAVLPDIAPVDAKGGDDLADLARAFNSMQETLIDVAHEQVEVLRRGVSDIFITMARRNRSLIDRQLSMLDEFEAGVDDHEVLSNYYQLDHLATRMRRNSESLLVLANAEPKRRRVKATEIDDVVRASIGEVEDYRRVEIQALESLQVKGTVVADISHLLAELLDNATSFSPPGSSVRVGGRRADDSYMLRIVDDGVGIAPDRLAELNELLREPPIVGLSVESTLGISVVSLLANKHDIDVTLSAGSPGLTVDVILPSSLFGPMDAPAEQPPMGAAPQPAAEQLVAWNGEQPAPATESVDAVATPSLPTEVADDIAPLVVPMMVADTTSTDTTSADTTSTDTASADTTSTDTASADTTSTEAKVAPLEPTVETDAFSNEAMPTIDSDALPNDVLPVEPAPTFETQTEVDPARAMPMFDTPVHEPQPAADVVPDEPAVPVASGGDWTSMSLDMSAFETAAAVVDEAPAAPVADAPEVAEVAEVAAPMPDPVVTDSAATIDLPPPPSIRSEFDVPPAPPITAGGLAHRPVSPDTARPAPVPTPPADATPALPTRTQRGTGPEGPDRLADAAAAADGAAPVATSEPGALQAALAAFESGRSAVNAPAAGDLPTRDRATESPTAFRTFDEPQAVTQSRVDPSALRDRLRAFQSEFSSASGDTAGGTDIYTDHNDQHGHDDHDSGGDPR